MKGRLGVVSDTHGDALAWQRVAAFFGQVEMVIHAGDVLYHGPRNPLAAGYQPPELVNLLNALPYPLLIAKGNCDAPIDAAVLNVPLQSPVLFLQYEGLRLLAHHGHQYSPEELLDLARRWGAKVCITGHTHVPRVWRQEGVVLINPGSPSLPKGSPPRPTAGLIADGKVQVVDVVTLEVLGEEPLEL